MNGILLGQEIIEIEMQIRIITPRGQRQSRFVFIFIEFEFVDDFRDEIENSGPSLVSNASAGVQSEGDVHLVTASCKKLINCMYCTYKCYGKAYTCITEVLCRPRLVIPLSTHAARYVRNTSHFDVVIWCYMKGVVIICPTHSHYLK